MAEEMSVPDDLTFKRKRAEAEESIVQIKRPRRESLGGENETTSTYTTEGHSETCGSSEKSYYESLRPITENPPNTESREDEEPLQEAFTACSSPSKHYKEDIDGSSSENSKETFVSVEIPVNHDEMGLRDESDSVENDLFLNHRRGSSPENSKQEFLTIEIPVNRDDTALQNESNSVENDFILKYKRGPSPESSKQESVQVEVQVNLDDTGLRDGNDSVEDDFFLNQGKNNASILYYRKTTTDDRGTITNISELSGIQSDVNVEQLVQATARNDKEVLEISGTSTKPGNDETEGGQDEYIYRILRFTEYYWKGLRPKNASSKISIQKHVAEGSKGRESRYISCSKTLNGIKRLGRLTNESSRIRHVVKINLTKVRKLGSEIQIIDLTDESIRIKHIDPDCKAWEFAEKYEEVILNPTYDIPSHCVEYIGNIQHRQFTPVATSIIMTNLEQGKCYF